MKCFKDILSLHQLVPRFLVYLADGYDIERYYKRDGSVDQRKTDAVRDILILYALFDTKKLHLTAAQVYLKKRQPPYINIKYRWKMNADDEFIR